MMLSRVDWCWQGVWGAVAVAALAIVVQLSAGSAAAQSSRDLLLPNLGILRGLNQGQQTSSETLDRSRLQGETTEQNQLATFPMPEPITPAELDQLTQFCHDDGAPLPSAISYERFSRLERDYCRRSGVPLFQFGYDNFKQQLTQGAIGVGAVSDDYLLGIGDELIVTFHGQTSSVNTVRVDREGRVVLPDLLPISAAGRRFGDFRAELEARAASAFLGTQVFVSVGAVRLVTLAVVGEVRNPGVYHVTSLSSIFDAIGLAGGIRKTGSLRKLIVQRGNQILSVDLYDVLITGVFDYQLNLFDGDRIFVPTIGPSVGVVGDVNRPGIYEMPEGGGKISKETLLRYAGGMLRPTGQTFLKMSFTSDGRETANQTIGRDDPISAGDIVVVRPRHDAVGGRVEVVGHVKIPGSLALSYASTVSALVRDREFKSNPYLLFAVLETTDPATQARRMFPINLERILRGEEDFSLRPDDKLIVLGREDVRFLMSTDVKNILLGKPVPGLTVETSTLEEVRRQTGAAASGTEVTVAVAPQTSTTGTTSNVPMLSNKLTDSERKRQTEEATGTTQEETEICPGLLALAGVVAIGKTQRYDSAVLAGLSEELIEFNLRRDCPEVYKRYPQVLPFALEHVAALSGEIRWPGAYPITPKTRLSSLISVADGLTRDTDRLRVELSRVISESAERDGQVERSILDITGQDLATALVEPSDIVLFNARVIDRDNGPVILSGEFARPGLYAIRRGERLSELIQRAGGLTDQAFPYGAIFTRERVKQAESEALQRAARQINSALSVVTSKSNIDENSVAALERLSEELEKAEPVGRVVIEADPTVLQVRPDLDTVLESSDRLFMPKRPNYVTVSGDVLNPTSVQFRAGLSASDYIGKAGGFQISADDGRVFVVFPNGEARQVGASLWNYQPVQIPPGSTIVVPRNPKPFDFLEFAKDVTPILSNLALTSAALASLSRN